VTRRQFAAESQIDVVTKGTGHWLLYKALEDARVSRRVTVRVPSFLGLAQIVAHTDLLALVPARLGKSFANDGNVRTLAAPIKLPTYVVKHYWHERYHRDPGNMWFRGVIYDVVRKGLKS
jgi:DNA-binding transcriptional LysR family regulator